MIEVELDGETYVFKEGIVAFMRMGGEHEFNYRPFENRHVAHGMEEKVKGACISTYCLRSNASLHFFNSLLGDFLGVFDGVLCFPSSPFLFGVFDGAIFATLRLIYSDVLIELLNLKKKYINLYTGKCQASTKLK